VRLDFSIFGEEQLSRDLLRFSAHVGNAKPALNKVADDMREQIAEQFTTEGDRGSGGWHELADSNIKAKAAEGLDPHILRATDDFMNSLVKKGDKWHVEEVTDESLLLGSKDWIGFLHQKGTSKMPARKSIDFTELDRRGFIRVLQRYFTEGTVA
jgi:phage gpG-like protein